MNPMSNSNFIDSSMWNGKMKDNNEPQHVSSQHTNGYIEPNLKFLGLAPFDLLWSSPTGQTLEKKKKEAKKLFSEDYFSFTPLSFDEKEKIRNKKQSKEKNKIF